MPTIQVFKTATCGCCTKWIDHLEAAGFEVEAQGPARPRTALKNEKGVPDGARVLPYRCRRRLRPRRPRPRRRHRTPALRSAPPIAGLAVPEMPLGSPGMEHPDPSRHQPYDVLSFGTDGVRVYASHPGTLRPGDDRAGSPASATIADGEYDESTRRLGHFHGADIADRESAASIEGPAPRLAGPSIGQSDIRSRIDRRTADQRQIGLRRTAVARRSARAGDRSPAEIARQIEIAAVVARRKIVAIREQGMRAIAVELQVDRAGKEAERVDRILTRHGARAEAIERPPGKGLVDVERRAQERDRVLRIDAAAGIGLVARRSSSSRGSACRRRFRIPPPCPLASLPSRVERRIQEGTLH